MPPSDKEVAAYLAGYRWGLGDMDPRNAGYKIFERRIDAWKRGKKAAEAGCPPAYSMVGYPPNTEPFVSPTTAGVHPVSRTNTSIPCPKCGFDRSLHSVQTLRVHNVVVRRRTCARCRYRYRTEEKLAMKERLPSTST